jgi:hypothetical protein
MVMVFHEAVGYSRDRPQSQHFFRDLKMGRKNGCEKDYFLS